MQGRRGMEHTMAGMDQQTHETLEHIAQSLRDAGYDPYEQLMGYIKTGDATYITRKGDARSLIQKVPMEQTERFAGTLSPSNRT